MLWTSVSDRTDSVWLLISSHIAVVYEHRYAFKFATPTVFFSSLPHTDVIRSFSLISSTPTLTPNIVMWLTRPVWNKEWEGHLSLGILHSLYIVTPGPLRPKTSVLIVPPANSTAGSSLSRAHLLSSLCSPHVHCFGYPSAPRPAGLRRRDLGGSVQAVSLTFVSKSV